MKCPLCEKESSRDCFVTLEDEKVYICRECMRKAEDDIFFDNMDRLHRTQIMTENISYFSNPFFKFYDRTQKLFFNTVMNWYGMCSKT
jgi:ribosome-binding protein aMBF1 (putative translation factor)